MFGSKYDTKQMQIDSIMLNLLRLRAVHIQKTFAFKLI